MKLILLHIGNNKCWNIVDLLFPSVTLSNYVFVIVKHLSDVLDYFIPSEDK